MSKLKDQPIIIDDENWYYEEIKGLCMVHQVKDTEGTLITTDTFYVPWKKVLESVRRKYPELFK